MAVEIRLLGPVEVTVDGSRVPIARRPTMLIARLALSEGRPVQITRLIQDIWGEDAPAEAANTVQVYVSGLRKTLGSNIIRTSGRAYALSDHVIVDSTVFREHLHSGLGAVQAGDDVSAVAWFGRGFAIWADHPLADLDELEFFAAERNSLTDLYLAGMEANCRIRLGSGQATAVVAELGPVIVAHPYHEGLRAQLIVALAMAGRQVEALDAYSETRTMLADTFGIDPGPELQAAHSAVLTNTLPRPRVAVKARFRLGVPEVPTKMVARQDELALLAGLCADPAVRLVTVTGTGGVGKTRLVQELVLQAEVDATFVSLLPAEEPEDVAATVCQSLSIALAGRSAEAAVAAAIADHHGPLLIVLDNFEHVLPAASWVGRLLGEAPQLMIVVTSRTPLKLAAERRFPLRPLSTDEHGIEPSDATVLLIERIRQADSGFRATAENLATAADISRLCDGVPLALEIAAARSSVLDLHALYQALQQPLSVLIREADPAYRWSSVQASVEWSVQALTPDTTSVLRAATVFRGGFTAAAVASVADMTTNAAADHLQRLLDYSLINIDSSSRVRRFAILQVVRETVDHSIDEAQRALTQDRHASYFRAVVGPQPDFRNFPATQRELDAIAAEAANFRTAVRRATTTSTGLLADLVVSLHGPWHRFGWTDELRGWLEQTLQRKNLTAERRVDCLMSLVRSGTQSGTDTALLDEIQFMPAATADPMRRQLLVNSLVSNRVWSNRFAEAQKLLADNRDEAAALGDPALLCERMNVEALGDLFQGRVEAAAAILRSAWTLAKENDLERLAMVSGHNLSELLLVTDAAEEAADVTAELIAAANGGPDLRRTAALSNFGAAKLLLGERAESLVALRSALSTIVNTGWINEGLDVLLRLAAALADTDPGDARSAFLFGVWVAVRKELGVTTAEPFAERLITTYLATVTTAAADSPLGVHREAGELRVAQLGAAGAFDATAVEELRRLT